MNLMQGKVSPGKVLAVAALAASGLALTGCVQYVGYGSSYAPNWNDTTAAAAAAGGADSGRLAIDQCKVDGTEGTWSTAPYASELTALKNNGLAAVIRLDSLCHGPNAAGFNDFAADVVKRAVALGVTVRAVQVWSEPNYAVNWGGKIDPGGYARMFKSAYNAVKSAYRAATSGGDVPVIGAGLAPLHAHPQKISCSYNDSTWMCPHNYLNQFLSKLTSLKGHLDGVGANFFPIENGTKVTPDGALDNVQREYNQVDSVDQKFGSLPIWASELGVRTDDAAGDLTGAEQGQVMKTAGDWLASQADLFALYIWMLIDNDTDLSNNSVPNYGVLTMSGEPKGGPDGAYCLGAKELNLTPSGC